MKKFSVLKIVILIVLSVLNIHLVNARQYPVIKFSKYGIPYHKNHDEYKQYIGQTVKYVHSVAGLDLEDRNFKGDVNIEWRIQNIKCDNKKITFTLKPLKGTRQQGTVKLVAGLGYSDATYTNYKFAISGLTTVPLLLIDQLKSDIEGLRGQNVNGIDELIYDDIVLENRSKTKTYSWSLAVYPQIYYKIKGNDDTYYWSESEIINYTEKIKNYKNQDISFLNKKYSDENVDFTLTVEKVVSKWNIDENGYISFKRHLFALNNITQEYEEYFDDQIDKEFEKKVSIYVSSKREEEKQKQAEANLREQNKRKGIENTKSKNVVRSNGQNQHSIAKKESIRSNANNGHKNYNTLFGNAIINKDCAGTYSTSDFKLMKKHVINNDIISFNRMLLETRAISLNKGIRIRVIDRNSLYAKIELVSGGQLYVMPQFISYDM